MWGNDGIPVWTTYRGDELDLTVTFTLRQDASQNLDAIRDS